MYKLPVEISMADAMSQQFVTVDQHEVAEIEQLAAEHGITVEVVPAKGFEPITTVTLLLLGSSAAIGIVLRLIDERKGGQVIDLRPGAERMIYRSQDIVYGLVTIIGTDGSVTVEVKEPRGAFGIVVDALKETITSAVGRTAKEIGDAARAAVGEQAKVTVVPV